MLFNNGVNRVFLVGEVSDDPRWQLIERERVLCFQLVTNEPFKKANAKCIHHEWHSIKIPKELAENGMALQKDDVVYIQGRIQTRAVFEEGVKQYKAEIMVLNIERVSTASQHVPAISDLF